MLNEENIMHTLVGVGLIGAFIGCWIGCYVISDDGSIKAHKTRRALGRGIKKVMKMRAMLVTSSKTIRRGH